MSEIASIAQLVTNTSQSTLASAIDVLRSFKTGERGDDYDAGYDDGLDQAIRAMQLFQKTMLEQSGKLSE